MKGQDIKHKSNIGLLNQLFDREGDKSNFAGMGQICSPQCYIYVPWRATFTLVQGSSGYW